MNAIDSSSGPTRATAISIPRVIAEVIVATIGGGLIAGALLANQDWLDRHILPSFYLMRRSYVFMETCARIMMVTAGALLVIVARPRIGRLAARSPTGVAAGIVAAVLALAAGELVLGWLRPSTDWLVSDVEPLRRRDPRLGWAFVPNRTAQREVAGRVIDYAFDSAGYRVPRLDDPVDPELPTILFAGESVMFGEGLPWEETVPAQVGAMMGIQSANLAVHGFATDQSYLRLESELPRFRHPVAVVSFFMPAIFGRNLDDDRPHLGPGLVWTPPVEHGRVHALAKLLVPYRRDATVERGIAMTRETFRATVALASARGAIALILVPQFNKEDELERALRRRILDETGLPYVFVEFETGWRLPGDLHPNAPTARALAIAVTERLRKHQAAAERRPSSQP